MLFDPARHEPLLNIPWDEALVRAAISRIVQDTEAHFTHDRYWPTHPQDAEGDDGLNTVLTPLYDGACGVIWALHHLQAAGAVTLTRSYLTELEVLRDRNRVWLGRDAAAKRASFLNGDTPILMLALGTAPTAALESNLASLIAGNLEHPSRELMSGAPGTMLAAVFLYEHTKGPHWADLFRQTAARLWSQLEWSAEHQCAYWTQEMYGGRFTCLDAVHGFVATASPLIRGRGLLDADVWHAWEQCIVNTIQRTAHVEGDAANWPAYLFPVADDPEKSMLQFCHGAPGFVICLGDLPSSALDTLLLAGGEATWMAGPLTKGSNLCHGTGGNGYAFLKLYARTKDPKWLERARAFAMHGIAQTDEAARHYGQMRYSLWTGDPGFAIYLWHCLEATADFPTLDVFYRD